MLEKLELMLRIYREKLERVNMPPIDYIKGVELSAQISLLENLYYYALTNTTTQQAGQAGELGEVEG